MLFTWTLAYLDTSGTVASRSSPEIAGTGACFTGSIFIAIVPPVAMNSTTGCALSANADTAITHAHPAAIAANLLSIAIASPMTRAQWRYGHGPVNVARFHRLSRRGAPGIYPSRRGWCSERAGQSLLNQISREHAG